MTMSVDFLVAHQALPADLVVHRSVGRLAPEAGGAIAGAILRTSDSSQWFGADYVGTLTDPVPSSNAAYWGPFASAAACRPYMIGDIVAALDSDGVDGASDWFEPYVAPLPAPGGE